MVNLARSFRTIASCAGVKTNKMPCFRREMMDRMRFAASRRNFLFSYRNVRPIGSASVSGLSAWVFSSVFPLFVRSA